MSTYRKSQRDILRHRVGSNDIRIAFRQMKSINPIKKNENKFVGFIKNIIKKIGGVKK